MSNFISLKQVIGGSPGWWWCTSILKQNCLWTRRDTSAAGGTGRVRWCDNVVFKRKNEETESAEESDSVMKKICDLISDEWEAAGWGDRFKGKGWSAEWLLVNYSTRSERRRDLLGEALCDGGVFSPGRDDGHLFGGDPQRLGRPLPAAERSDGGHLCCTSERSICLVGVTL